MTSAATIAAIDPSKSDALREVMMTEGIVGCEIGEFVETTKGVELRDGDTTVHLGRLESERFAPDSWFHLGIEAYEEMLRSLTLPHTS